MLLEQNWNANIIQCNSLNLKWLESGNCATVGAKSTDSSHFGFRAFAQDPNKQIKR